MVPPFLARIREEPEPVVIAVINAVAIRIAILVVALVATVTIPSVLGKEQPAPGSALLELPNRWDAGWYVGIASGGYRYRASNDIRWNRLAFFPAYPLALRFAAHAFFVPRSPAAWAWVGAILSLLAFAGATAYVYLIARRLRPDAADQAVVLLAAYPWALFFGAAYTESFYLLGAAGAMWHFGQREFARAALWGLFVGLVRPNGMLLSVPLLVWAFSQNFVLQPRQRWALACA